MVVPRAPSVVAVHLQPNADSERNLQFGASVVAAAVPQSKPKKKKKKPKLPASLSPHNCAILCVDAGENSGYAAYDRATLRWFGECDVFGDGPKSVLEQFLELPGPHVLVVERPFQVKFASQTGIGTADRIWRELAGRMGFGKRIVRVYPNEWRAVGLGKGVVGGEREEIRKKEVELACEVVRQANLLAHFAVGPDSAPAIMMGKWASYAGRVLRVLPKMRPPSKVRLPSKRMRGLAKCATESEAV
jgi:hypothetical protein